MFGSDDFWDKSPSWVLKIFKLQISKFQNFQKFTRAIYPKSPDQSTKIQMSRPKKQMRKICS